MILGYEQPVDIPVMSIYDKDMMKMYLGALQQDYKEGLEEQKAFNKMAADFYSPSDVDNQNWYNLTAKPLQDYLNQNPNAIRSVEGRAWIRNFINSRPYDKMAQMKQSAETLKNYKELASKLKAAGKFSQDLEDVLGVGDPNTWDTLRDGAWQWESPTEMQSVYDLTHERFDPLAKLDFDLGPGRDKYHRIKGVTEEHMRPIAKTSLDGIRNTPYYKLFLKRYGSDEAIEDAFINANKGVLHNSEITDDAELAKLRQSLAGTGRGRSGRGNSGPSTDKNYIHDNVMNNLISVHRDNAKQIDSDLKNGDPKSLMLSQAKILKEYEGKGSAYDQSMRLAGKETNNGFYARFGMPNTGTVSYTSKDKEGSNTSRQTVNAGIEVDGQQDLVQGLRSLRDISVNAYGARKLKATTYRKTQNGNSEHVSHLLRINGADGKRKMESVVTNIAPIGGDKNIIYQINNDGTFHAYRKVRVSFEDYKGNTKNLTLWYDYGQVDWNDDASEQTTAHWLKLSGTGTKPRDNAMDVDPYDNPDY